MADWGDVTRYEKEATDAIESAEVRAGQIEDERCTGDLDALLGSVAIARAILAVGVRIECELGRARTQGGSF